MATSISRRSVLAAGAGAAAGLALPGVAAQAGGHSATRARFTLNAETLDGGEQVTSLTIATGGLGRIDPASLSTGTFTVHAKATSPIPIAPGDQIFSEYDLDRAVTAHRLDHHGDIVLDLAYTITQNAPFAVRGHRPVTITEFVQGRLSNPEVDAFRYAISASGMKYRLFQPSRRFAGRGRRPLVVWLHGGGEGASLPDNYYDNETTLRANRGALGFATPEAQRIFAGAYVVAPQSTSFWLEDGDRFAPLIREIVREVARRHPVDRDRISVVGASNGGYMSLKMTTVYPDLFAASVPICGVVQSLQPGGPTMITDAELRAIRTPTWLVTSRDDDTVPPVPNTVHAHELIDGSLLSLYDNVVWNGHQFPGHWSWIYVARNDPRIDGTRIWQWMARQRT